MFKKSLIAAALVVPAFALSSAAFAGQLSAWSEDCDTP